MAVLKIVGMGIASLVVVSVLVLGYLGFVPGLSGLMGASNPVDLGVNYTSVDLASANAKLGVNYTAPTDGSSLSLEGSKQVNIELTDEELSALVNDYYEKWKFYPVKDFQIKVGPAGNFTFPESLT